MNINYTCIVQEGIVPDDLRAKLAGEIKRISASVLDIDEGGIGVEYYEVRHGFGFRGGEVSTTSTVRGQLTEALDQDTRVDLMTQIMNMWRDETGCEVDEFLVSVRDPQ
ncbi:MAG: hypothetical protein F4X34_03400 [Chloroflexi bacterium]|nr:hypothetical protein [Chloroflexota bacterium]